MNKIIDLSQHKTIATALCHTIVKKDDKYFVTGWSKEIEEGDLLLVSNLGVDATVLVVEGLRKRDHNGIFENPSDKINSHFSAICVRGEIPQTDEQTD